MCLVPLVCVQCIFRLDVEFCGERSDLRGRERCGFKFGGVGVVVSFPLLLFFVVFSDGVVTHVVDALICVGSVDVGGLYVENSS